MSLTDQSSILEGDSVTIVSTLRYGSGEGGYADGRETVVFNGEGYLGCVCVDGVFDEFFEGGVDVEDELTA